MELALVIVLDLPPEVVHRGIDRGRQEGQLHLIGLGLREQPLDQGMVAMDRHSPAPARGDDVAWKAAEDDTVQVLLVEQLGVPAAGPPQLGVEGPEESRLTGRQAIPRGRRARRRADP